MSQACSMPDCDKLSRTRGLCKTHYNRTLPSYGAPPRNVEQRRAGWRAKNRRRRAARRYTDVTTEYENLLRAKARRCPLCRVKLVNQPFQPNSRELDRIVPGAMGGTYSIGNVRITCRLCNEGRPKDGSDYTGPVTLWAEQPGFVKREPSPAKTKPVRQCPECACGARLRRGRCWTCHPYVRPRYIPSYQLTDEQKRERTHRAAQMRADGSAWWDIADTLGFGRESSALQAVRDMGKRAATKRGADYVTAELGHRARPHLWSPPTPTRGACVDCGDPVVRGTERCVECWTEINESNAA